MSVTDPLWEAAFSVTVDPGQVALFSRALGGQDHAIPPTFPITWLGRPDIKAALASAVVQLAGPQGALLHLAQRFDQVRSTAFGATYILTVDIKQGKAPGSLLIEANYADECGSLGGLVAEFLVLFPDGEP